MLIKNILISTGAGNKTKKCHILIKNGKIYSVSESLPKLAAGQEVIDGKGLLALPGCIDPHVHFDTPGFESREDFAHGSRAAIAGGVTTVIDMPCTSLPPVVNVTNLKNKLSLIKKMAYCDFALWGGVSKNAIEVGNWLYNMEELWQAGVVGFKTYLVSGMETFRAPGFMELGQIFQKCRSLGALVAVHSENQRLVLERTAELIKAGKKGIMDYYASRAEPVEREGVLEVIGLANYTKARTHIVHVGAANAVKLIEAAKRSGLDISAETCPHYLAFTKDDFKKLGSLIKTAPVIKEKQDQDALWAALKDGIIDFVATDHAPCSLKDKKTGNAFKDYGGIPGTQYMLPYLFSEGYKKGRLTLARLIEVTSSCAAKRYGLSSKGSLRVGNDADIVLIDPKKRWKVKAQDAQSKAKWTPFEGRTLTGKIKFTILRGKLVYADVSKTIQGPFGKPICVR